MAASWVTQKVNALLSQNNMMLMINEFVQELETMFTD